MSDPKLVDSTVQELESLIPAFLDEYAYTEEGRRHAAAYDRGRREARDSFAEIQRKLDAGEDVTDLILLRFLPHRDSAGNRERGAWIHIAPAVTKDIREWFEASGWTKPEDWPRIAQALWQLVHGCVENPKALEDHCGRFSALPYSKGFQAGLVSPILNALKPESFLILNSKSRRVVNRASGQRYLGKLEEYPAMNDLGWKLITRLGPRFTSAEVPKETHPDVFDQFTHWLVAIRKWGKKGDEKASLVADSSPDAFREDSIEEDMILGPESPEWSGSDNPAFDEQAFRLLDRLHANPTRAFYMEHAEEFKEHIQEPFHRILREVGRRLPARMLWHLEVEKNLFSRFIKNDYGRGGAYDFYWGAFYSKGGSRISGAQLALVVHRNQVQISFFIGQNGVEQRARLVRNLKASEERTREALSALSADPRFSFGRLNRETWSTSLPSFEAWLAATDAEDLASVSRVIQKPEALSMSMEGLVQEAVTSYSTLFPLFLMASLDDPWAEIDGLLEGEPEPVANPRYSVRDLHAETGFRVETLDAWARILSRKRRIVLQGPPGTGKTYLAVRFGKLLLSETEGIAEIVQFHPAYAYEDFIQGIRPQANSGTVTYDLVDGRFLNFCRSAEACRPHPAVLIVDEINRANLPRVFGELMYLLEYDDQEIPLAAGGKPFRIPDNVYLIGTMNTADRSIARLDHALRRRFAFIRVPPDYDALALQLTQRGYESGPLLNVLRKLNGAIEDPNYEVGISFFLGVRDLAESLGDVWACEIEPYLEEYFFDHPGKVEPFRWSQLKRELGDWLERGCRPAAGRG